jgi:zinc/manganese transport system substrate-binding protein
LDAVDALRTKTSGKSYAATETIFNYMASAVGLQDKTPASYEIASIDEETQTPETLKEFRALLNKNKVSVLVFNTQTSDPVAEEFVGIAAKRNIPVVNVTETVPPEYQTFVSWQMAQLQSLSDALDSAVTMEDHNHENDHGHDHDDGHDHE